MIEELNRTPGDLMVRLRPEVRLLLAAAGVWDASAREAMLRSLLAKDLDWEFLIEIAERNQVVGLVYQGLSAMPRDAVPMPVLSRLRTVHLETTQHTLLLQRELVRVLDALSKEDIAALPFKGPLMSVALYGNLALRQTWDIDVLCRKDDVLRAKGVLEGLGYVLEDGTVEEDVAHRLRSDCELTLVHPESGAVVEIHWDLLPKALGRASSGAFLWDGAQVSHLEGAVHYVAAPASVLTMLFLHGGVKHMWDEVRIVSDVARALGAFPQSDLNAIVDEMKRRGSQRHALVGLLLASRLLGAELPETVEKRIARNPQVAAAAALAMGRMFNVHLGLPSYRDWQAYLQGLQRDARGAAGGIARYIRGVLSPEFQDYILMPPLPEFLGSIHYLVRVFRLAGKVGFGLHRRV